MKHLDLRNRKRLQDNWLLDVDRIFDDFFGGQELPTAKPLEREFHPQVDVREGNDHYLISADLPGINEKDISVEVKDRVLTISGERNFEKSEGEGRYHKFERGYGKFQRSFQLPDTIDEGQVQASYENGVLEILIPRAEVAKSKSVKIETGKGGLFKSLLGSSDKKDVN